MTGPAPLPGAGCYHGADECPSRCMCPCDLCYLLRTDAYLGDAIDPRDARAADEAPQDGP